MKRYTNNNFIFLGGDPILDFCNTELIHQDECVEFLKSKSDFTRWLRALKFQGEKNHESIKPLEQPISESQFKELLVFRNKLRSYFQATIDAEPGKSVAAKNLNLFLSRLYLKKQLITTEGTERVIDCATVDKHFFLNMVANWLSGLLNRAEGHRLKRCGNPNCSHFFRDLTKNNSREWCSMQSCGNLMKAKAFYQREKNKWKKESQRKTAEFT